MSEIEPRSLKHDDSEAFTIRGHHINFYGRLITMGDDAPVRLSKEIRQAVEVHPRENIS